jgi:long-chain acyl-CoA synthetase
LENLGRELPEYQRVHDFVLRAEPLPRTTTRKVRRFELQNELEGLRKQQGHRRPPKGTVLTETERALMDSPAGRATVAAVRQHVQDVESIQPSMNFEIDLSLDSLARAECFASVEQTLSIELTPEELSTVQTVGELVQKANAKVGGGPSASIAYGAEFHWHDVLEDTRELPEVKQLLKPKPALALLAYVVLRLIYFAARLLFRLEVRGRDTLTQLEPPYLICPNHQSYIDPFLVCSTYPRHVLQNTFHVGASMYFTNSLMAQLARLINVVPIDPDLQLLRAMRAGGAGLRAKKILNIYPEGQRSFDGKLHEFKKGGAILATELKLPIVPVALDGTYRIWPRKSWRFRRAKVKITFGEPIDAPKIALNEADKDVAYEKVTTIVKQQIQQMLDESRKNSRPDQ